MDKVTLNREQLLELVAFIRKRGISQPMVVAEVLDHFACKVEEAMMANPKADLAKAMESAYSGFGPLGFYSLRRSIEQSVFQKYKTLYRSEMKKVLASPMQVLVALLFAFCAYIAFSWGNSSSLVFGLYLNPAYIVAFTLFVSLEFVMLRKLAGKLEDKQIVTAARGPLAFGVAFSFLASAMSRFDQPTELGSKIMAVIATCLCFYLVIRFFVARSVLSTGLDEESVVQNYLSSLSE